VYTGVTVKFQGFGRSSRSRGALTEKVVAVGEDSADQSPTFRKIQKAPSALSGFGANSSLEVLPQSGNAVKLIR
jgi:hypothetical protein